MDVFPAKKSTSRSGRPAAPCHMAIVTFPSYQECGIPGKRKEPSGLKGDTKKRIDVEFH
jgi:hypothetical protein